MNRLGRSVLVVGMSLMAVACGRKGPLIYPDMLVPAAPASVTAQQSGAVVKLQFSLTDKDRAGRAVKKEGVVGVRISRKTSETGQSDICRSCMTDYRLLRTLYLDNLPAIAQRFGNRLIVLDSDVSAGNSYSYSIVPFTTDGMNGASSPIAVVRVAAPLPAPVVRIEPLPAEIKLHISFQVQVAEQVLGYNLYRSSVTGVRSYQALNREPLKGNEYIDTALERGIKYRYSARALAMRASGDIAESAESIEVEGMLKDDE